MDNNDENLGKTPKKLGKVGQKLGKKAKNGENSGKNLNKMVFNPDDCNLNGVSTVLATGIFYPGTDIV